MLDSLTKVFQPILSLETYLPIIVPCLLRPAQTKRRIFRGLIEVTPPDLELVVDRIHAQKHGGLLFLLGAGKEGLSIVRDLLITVPELFSVAQSRGSLVRLFGHVLPILVRIIDFWLGAVVNVGGDLYLWHGDEQLLV